MIYAGLFADPDQLEDGQRVTVPTAFADMDDPLVPTPPRSLVEKAFNVVAWTTPRTGGRLAPFAAPDVWTADLVSFAERLRTNDQK